jgi:hypothetical protein
MKQIRNLFLLLFLLITACSQPPALPTASPTSPPPPTTTPSPDEAPAPTLSESDRNPYWDDRTVFAPSLVQSAQPILDQLPLATSYKIDLNIPNDIYLPATGHLEVRYFNQESTALNEIVFRLFPNYNGGEQTVSNVLVDELPVDTSLEAADTTLVVHLAQPLDVYQSVVISMDFNLVIPTFLGGNYGLLSYTKDTLVLDLFYPMIPAYDRYGWYREYPAPSGDLSYNDIGFYKVNVSAPQEMLLAASGSQASRTVEGDRQQVTYVAGPARDFYLAGSKEFTVISAQVGETTVNSYALPGHESHQQHVVDYISKGMVLFGDLFGPYPYTEFDVIASPMLALGIEYPGIVGIFNDLYIAGGYSRGFWNEDILETVVIHELAHQWFYNMIGNDQQDQPWVDESITQYAVYLYMDSINGKDAAEARLNGWYSRWSQIDYVDIPIGLRVRDYAREVYSPIVYGRGPLFFSQLSGDFGQETVIDALANYVQQNQWQIAKTQSIRESLEQSCQCDLTDYFVQWVYP